MIGKNSFQATDPATGAVLDGDFFVAGQNEVDLAVEAASAAHQEYKHIDKNRKSAFLRTIADELTLLKDDLVARAAAESGLPVARLQGEVGRTTGQLRLFADMVEEGSWVQAVIDRAEPERTPLPKADIRRMLVPIGPVVVFGASNFPLAFSVAGGDTASALAAGCPVIVKAHPAHPGTSALAAAAIMAAVKKCGMPEGVFSMLYDNGYEVGKSLVLHPGVKAVAFTGSYQGGMALVHLARERKEPIPVFAEMGSINPVFLFPEALENRAGELAAMYSASITLGAGQFCTNPGLLLGIKSPALNTFSAKLAGLIEAVPPATMLTPGIHKNYLERSSAVFAENGVTELGASSLKNEGAQCQSEAKVATVSAADFLSNPKLQEEIFGPYSLLVVADDLPQLKEVAKILEGQLTVTLMAEKTELPAYSELISMLSDKTGRIILNNVPTGVEVCGAMQHGGPFPSTSDSRFTSVGSSAVYRFVRPLAWQNWEDELLPAELQHNNPLNIFRLSDHKWTKE